MGIGLVKATPAPPKPAANTWPGMTRGSQGPSRDVVGQEWKPKTRGEESKLGMEKQSLTGSSGTFYSTLDRSSSGSLPCSFHSSFSRCPSVLSPLSPCLSLLLQLIFHHCTSDMDFAVNTPVLTCCVEPSYISAPSCAPWPQSQ